MLSISCDWSDKSLLVDIAVIQYRRCMYVSMNGAEVEAGREDFSLDYTTNNILHAELHKMLSYPVVAKLASRRDASFIKRCKMFFQLDPLGAVQWTGS